MRTILILIFFLTFQAPSFASDVTHGKWGEWASRSIHDNEDGHSRICSTSFNTQDNTSLSIDVDHYNMCYPRDLTVFIFNVTPPNGYRFITTKICIDNRCTESQARIFIPRNREGYSATIIYDDYLDLALRMKKGRKITFFFKEIDKFVTFSLNGFSKAIASSYNLCTQWK